MTVKELKSKISKYEAKSSTDKFYQCISKKLQGMKPLNVKMFELESEGYKLTRTGLGLLTLTKPKSLCIGLATVVYTFKKQVSCSSIM